MKISNNKSPAPGRTADDKCPTLGKQDLMNTWKGRSRLELTEPSGKYIVLFMARNDNFLTNRF